MATFYANNEQQLIDAINAANNNGEPDIIYLAENTTFEMTTYQYQSGGGSQYAFPIITDDLTVIGGSNTIVDQSANPRQYRYFLVDQFVKLHLENISFRNGAIGVFGRQSCVLEVVNCDFLEHWLGVTSQNIRSVLIDACHFTGVTGSISAFTRGINLFGTDGQVSVPIKIYNTIIKGFKQEGTFVSQTSGTALIISDGDRVNIHNCRFENNLAYRGPITFQNDTTVNMSDCEILDNVASIGIVRFDLNSTQNAQITNTLISNNICVVGTVYGTNGGKLTILNTTIKDNVSDYNDPVQNVQVAAAPGAAVWTSIPTTIKFCNLINNTVNSLNSADRSVTSSQILIDATENYWGSDDGPSGEGPGSGDSISPNVDYDPFIGVSNPPENEGPQDCNPAGGGTGVVYASDADLISAFPVSLKTGEKHLEETDLLLNTPLGRLALTRRYRQSQQDSLDFMGLGWTHNHIYSLVEDGGTPNKITVSLAGSKAIFYDDDADDIFEGVAGNGSVIVKASSEYDLTTPGEAVYHFDSNQHLTTLTLNTGDVWSYSYDGSGNLTQVADGYGRSLEFAYYSGLSGADAFKNGLLWRVGTLGVGQTSDLSNTTPTMPYIELDYTDDGSGDALLTDVTDLRGETWVYRYYGSETGETDTKWTNFLVETFSPSVDSDGDETADGSIQLQELTYSGTARDAITQIVQKRGDELVTNTMDFDPANDVTTETIEGLVTTHNFTNGVYVGSKNAADDEQSQPPLSNYRAAYQEDAKGNRTGMRWSADGKRLEGIMDGEYNETTFSYDSQDRLIASTDAEGRITNYIYEGSRRQPSQIMVADDIATDLVVNGDMEANSDWSNVGTPVTSQQSQTEVSDGDNSWYVDADAAGEGIESTLAISFAANKTYLITARVFVVGSGEQVKMSVTNDSNWDVVSSEDGQWETLRAIHTPSAALTEKLQFLAEGGVAEFYVDSVHVVELTGLHRWQQFVYDAKDRTLGEYLLDHETATELQATERQYGTSGNGNGLLQQITIKDLLDSSNDSTTQYDYDAQGRVIRTHKISMFGSCQYNHTVYDAAGNVLGTACGLVTASPIPSDVSGLSTLYDALDADKKHTKITTYTYDELGRRVTTSSSGATVARTNRTIYDALGRVVRTIQNYVAQGSSAPGDWVWSASNQRWEYSDSDTTAISHGTNLDENIISDTDYNGRGLVYRRRDVLGRVMLYGYNTADRLVKTVQHAATPDYDMTYATGDPDLSAYSASSNTDADIITEQVYDPNGNVVKSIDARGSVTFTAYDALNRPVKVISNAVQASYDILSDLSLASYGAYSTQPDQDMVSTTDYDAMGRVIRSQRLLENRGAAEDWDTMLYGYDALGRQVRSIQHASVPAYDLSADPSLAGYTLSTDTDVDMLSQTRYDVQGRVKETEDVNGRITRMVYDGLNRQVMTIANFVAQATEPENWVWDTVDTRWEDGAGVAIDHGTDNDQNIITQTVYDSDGRVESTRNVEGLQSRNAYDVAGRSLLSIQNFVDNSYVDPAGTLTKDPWNWDNTQERWEDGDGTAIARGVNFDQNLISKPDYDDENRVFQTRDTRGNLTRMVYDESGRQVISIANFVAQATEPENWVWDAGDARWEDGSGVAIDHGTDNDQNRISTTDYDLLGRAFRTRDVAGRESYTVYDAVGRVVRRVNNYVQQGSTIPDDWTWNEVSAQYEYSAGNAVDMGTDNDQNIISETQYNQAGQVVSTRDAFGTQSSFVYDAAGRRLQVTQASNTGLATSSYTCFDKAGRVLRTVANYKPQSDGAGGVVSPDAWDTNEDWVFHPAKYVARETNLISEMRYDRASRRVMSINTMGNVTQTAYFKDGQVDKITDPEGMVTVYRYDALRRRKLVVQSFVANGEDPSLWVYDDVTDNRYEESNGTAIVHGTDNDQNIIVMVSYDIAGRMVSMRDPRGNLTSYEYDKLGRRTKLTNPLSIDWVTTYAEVNGAQQTTMTYPGVNGGSNYDMVRDFDRLGRLQQIDYNQATSTPKVTFDYDILGNRLAMVENDGTNDVRITGYIYDQQNRLTQVDFDTDGDSLVDETVNYEYDIRGLRTKLTMPGNLSISYSYDEKGRLVSLEDWDTQKSDFSYDPLNRHVATQRPNGMRSRYRLDGAGRLRELRHENKQRETLAAFRYTVDGRGNRVRAEELRLEPSATAATAATATIAHTDSEVVYTGTWTNNAGFHETTQWDAKMALLFVGDENVDLVIGEGSDHSIFDLYIDGSLYKSIDGYAASAGSRTVSIDLTGDGFHVLEIRNRHEKNLASSGYKVRFKQLAVDTALTHDVIDYSYDDLSRLIEANYNNGATVYNYGYDEAGNLVDYDGVTRTYNAANQMTNDGTNTLSYDNNGNLTQKGALPYTWDRANRLKSNNGHSYTYDGLGNRVQEIVADGLPKTYDYLNDVAGGLTKLLSETFNSDVTRYVHAPRSIHAMEQANGNWLYHAQDGLGSVRGATDDAGAVLNSASYTPYGELASGSLAGTTASVFGFTGEQVNASGQVFLRARYYEPQMGMFSGLDPMEGKSCTPMSLNRYGYVHGNPVMMTDPSGMIAIDIPQVPLQGWGKIGFSNEYKGGGFIINWQPTSPQAIKGFNSGLCGSGGASSLADQLINNLAGTLPLLGNVGGGVIGTGGSGGVYQGGGGNPAICLSGGTNEEKRLIGCCDNPNVPVSTKRSIGCVEETCRKNCELGLIIPFVGLFDYINCTRKCISETNSDRLSETTVEVSIALYSFNVDYTNGSGTENNKNEIASAIQPNHAFFIFWEGSNGTAYFGGPRVDGKIFVSSQGITGPGQYNTWLSEQTAGRGQGPFILLTGLEAQSRKKCLDDEVGFMQERIDDDPNAKYNPFNKNSNSVAFSLLRNCGIPVDITTYGFDWLPAYRTDL